MIRRTSSKITPSLVNTAQEEVLLVKDGIRTDAPINNLDSVEECVNFESELDGTLVLRKPLILEEEISVNTYTLFDKKHILIFDNKQVDIKRFEYVFEPLPVIRNIYLVWYDKTGIKQTKLMPPTSITDSKPTLNFLTINSSLVLQDSNLFSVTIDNTLFESYISPTSGIVYDNLNYGNKLLRIMKVYSEQSDDGTEEDWYFEIISPMLSNFTSSLDVGNSNALQVDLLADNPYALRDIYDYGYYSATKIIAYADIGTTYSSTLKVNQLTESLPTSTSGFKIINTLRNKTNSDYNIILKAFITTSHNTNLRMYCTWEESTDDGITWKPCEKFLEKYPNPTYLSVMDITAEEFEKKLEAVENNSLDLTSNYLVTKPMVLLNPNNNLSEVDTCGDRPDVLPIGNQNVLKQYRFLIYLDTGKEIKPVSDVVRSVIKSYFKAGEAYLDSSGIISYTLPLGVTYTEGQVSIPTSTNIVLSPDSKYKITKVRIRLSTSSPSVTFNGEADPTIAGEEYSKDYSGDYGDDVTISVATSGDPGIIYSIAVTYSTPSNTEITSIYEHSFAGPFKFEISDKTELTKDLSQTRNDLFKGHLSYWENQIIGFGKGTFFRSNLDKLVFEVMNTVGFGTDIVKIVPWRQYLLIFTEKDITLADYDITTDTYSYKTISNSIGVPKVDADTIVVILNSVYFKSGFKIYKLLPNLYSSSDSILNLHVVSSAIEKVLIERLSRLNQSHNFVYADAETYKLFIPVSAYNSKDSVYGQEVNEITYCFTYFLDKKIWTIQEYPIVINSVEILDAYETFLKTNRGYYYFNTELKALLKNYYIAQSVPVLATDDDDVEYSRIGYSVINSQEDTTNKIVCAGNSDEYITLEDSYDKLPYADFLTIDILTLYSKITSVNYYSEKKFEEECHPMHIPFKIDFGQQSSNYTIDKQYLETKFVFSTSQAKDCFPIDIYISMDGNGFSTTDSAKIHIDANTDSAFWKQTLDDKGTLSTSFGMNQNTEYDGIMRQMIVKYSGRGKTVHHIITGKSQSRFKIYNLLVRSRISPRKQ